MIPNFLTSTVARAAVFAVGALMFAGAAAGASAALGGPNPAGDVLDSVGVTHNDHANSDDGGGISHSSASDRGKECANPNASEGRANSQDKSKNADDAHTKPHASCSRGQACGRANHASPSPTPTATATPRNHGNGCPEHAGDAQDCDAQGEDRHVDEASPTPTATPGAGCNENENEGINNANDEAEHGKECASENAFEGAANAHEGSDNADHGHDGDCSHGH